MYIYICVCVCVCLCNFEHYLCLDYTLYIHTSISCISKQNSMSKLHSRPCQTGDLILVVGRCSPWSLLTQKCLSHNWLTGRVTGGSHSHGDGNGDLWRFPLLLNLTSSWKRPPSCGWFETPCSSCDVTAGRRPAHRYQRHLWILSKNNLFNHV